MTWRHEEWGALCHIDLDVVFAHPRKHARHHPAHCVLSLRLFISVDHHNDPHWDQPADTCNSIDAPVSILKASKNHQSHLKSRTSWRHPQCQSKSSEHPRATWGDTTEEPDGNRPELCDLCRIPPFLRFISKEHHSISSLSCKHMQTNYGASQLFQHAPYILGGQEGKDVCKETSQGQQLGCLLRGHYERSLHG